MTLLFRLMALAAAAAFALLPELAAAKLPPGVEIRADVDARTVMPGDRFTYQISVLGGVSVEAIEAGIEKLKDIQIVSGPNKQVSMTYVNGRSQTIQATTWDVQVTSPGKIAIPPARVRISGAWYETNAIDVTVREEPAEDTPIPGILSARSSDREVNKQLRNRYFAVAEVPDSPYRGQAVPVDVYIYRDETLRAFLQWDMTKEPSGDDFLMPEAARQQTAAQPGWERVKVGERTFLRTRLLTTYVVPTRSGKLRLNPPLLRIALPLQERRRSSMDDFFSIGPMGSPSIVCEMPLRPIDIDVKEIPAKPDDAVAQVVGNVVPTVTVDRTVVPRRELLTLSVSLKGNACLDLLSAPALPEFPNLSPLDTKTKNESQIRNGRFESSKTFDYVFQATKEGEVELPALAFAVFDPATKQQQVVRSEPIKVRISGSDAETVVLGGTAPAAAAAAKEAAKKAEAKELGRDVAYIVTAPLQAEAMSPRKPFYLQAWFWALQGVPLALSLGFGGVRLAARTRGAESAEAKLKKSRKVALNALKAAEAKVDGGTRDEFYATLSNGIMGYAATLLGRTPQGLTGEEAVEQLLRRGHARESVQRLSAILAECGAARYSPAPDTPDARRKALADAVAFIASLEEEKAR